MNYEKNNDNTNKIKFNKWIGNTLLEENTKPIITKKNEYSSMSYHVWLSVKNYSEITSNDDNKLKIITSGKKKNKIKIYTLMFDRMFSFSKLKIFMNFNIKLKSLKNFMSLNVCGIV
jgi:hypothetical protein